MKKKIKIAAIFCTILFIFMNIIAGFHAYKFMHFVEKNGNKTQSPHKLSTLNKVKTLLFGVNNPRPENAKTPSCAYETVVLQSSQTIECWHIKIPNSRGTVVLFHGYSASKSSLLDQSAEFNALGYNTLLVDFIGSGGSGGNQTTVGFKEGEDVKTCMDYLQKQDNSPIILFGTSMGAAAILRASSEFSIRPVAAILECPFGTMYETTCARFRQMNVPPFPMAGLLLFWGGAENGFWAFSHNPQDYAKQVDFPVLLLYGEQDKNVSRKEIDAIYTNLKGKKSLSTYPQAGHENYLLKYKTEWIQDVSTFLNLSF